MGLKEKSGDEQLETENTDDPFFCKEIVAKYMWSRKVFSPIIFKIKVLSAVCFADGRSSVLIK